jgi:membrane protein DedA with SNARE-associated domain
MANTSPNFLLLTRVGFAARGLLYLIIGYLALQLGQAKDAGGALEHVSREAGGAVLGAIALGFVAYGIWRVADSIFDTQNKGKDAKGLAGRAAGALSGLIHLGLAFTAMKLALGSGSGRDSSESAESGAAAAMSLPGGDLLLYLAAAILAAAGAAQLWIALKRGFCKHLESQAKDKWWVIAAGVGGHSARGIIFLAAAWMLFNAARRDRAEEAGALGDALLSLPDGLRAAVAAGLCLFGVYSLIEARYRIIPDPRVKNLVAGAFT